MDKKINTCTDKDKRIQLFVNVEQDMLVVKSGSIIEDTLSKAYNRISDYFNE